MNKNGRTHRPVRTSWVARAKCKIYLSVDISDQERGMTMRHTQLNKELENMDIFVDIILRNSHTSTVLRQLYLCQYNVFLVSCFYGPVFMPVKKTVP